jgi:predicted AAA+ superfamily ATPase
MLGVPRPTAVGQVMEALRRKRVALVTGPRRSGKTTILYQCVEGLIGSGAGADRVLLAMLDHPLLSGKGAIGEVVEWFMAEFKHLRGTPLHVLLDEAHRAQEWGAWAKTLHDVYRFPLVLSGSSAMELEAGSMEGLTDRHEAVRVRPLGLREYLEFRSLTPAPGDAHMMPRLADDYLVAGGFPEAVLAPDDHSRRSLLLHLFDDILLGDIVGARPIRDVATLRAIATMVLSSTGTPISFRKIARAVGCSVDTAEDYVGHMMACHLVSPAPFHSRSARERTRNP